MTDIEQQARKEAIGVAAWHGVIIEVCQVDEARPVNGDLVHRAIYIDEQGRRCTIWPKPSEVYLFKPSLMVGFSEEEIIGMVDEYRENEEDAVGFEIASQRSVGYEDALEWVLDKINEIPAVKPTDEEIERVALDKYMKMNVRFAGHPDASEGKERTIYLKPVSPTPSEPDTDLVDKIIEVVKEVTWINDVDLLRERLMKMAVLP